MFRQRIRVFFTKEGLLAFLGHQDLMRLFERALRRAGLPLAYSGGFNPRLQMSFPLALPLGCESRSEVMEVDLVHWTSPRRVREELERQLPEGIGVKGVESVGHGDRAQVTASEFSIEFEELPENFAARLDVFLEKEEAFVQRVARNRTKLVNIARFVRRAVLEGRTLLVEFAVGSEGTARPPEVVAAVLEIPPEDLPALKVTRTGLTLAAPPQS